MREIQSAIHRATFLSCLAIWSLLSPASQAQGLHILSTTPADSAAGVALESEVGFHFDQSLDTTSAQSADDLPIGAFIGPRDSLTIRQHRTVESQTNLRIDVTHTPETDYTWIVTGAAGTDTTSLDVPYVLRYTTAAAWGAHAVRGTVARAWLVKRGDPDPRDVVVALLDEPLTQESDWTYTGFDRIVAAVRVPENSEFEIDHVRDGTYWPVAFLDIDNNGRIDGEDRVAPYGDTEPDSITVDGANVNDVHIVILIGGHAEATEQPGDVRMGQIRPNPTRGTTQVELELSRPATVSVRLFNVLGQEVDTVIDSASLPSGLHEAQWDASTLAAGAYICRLHIDGSTLSRLFVVAN